MQENRLHQECYIWYHNTFPNLRGLLCYNLNNSKNKIDGARNKSMGLQAGRSDMVFYYNGRAVMLECKVSDGRQSQGQKQWQELIESQGFEYHIFRDLETFKTIINETITSSSR